MELVLTDHNFDQEIKKNTLPVLVDFAASWCGPCRMMAPIIDEIAKEYEGKLIVGKVDVDASPKTAQKFSVMSIPALILFKDGQPVKQMVGFQGKEALVKALQGVIPS